MTTTEQRPAATSRPAPRSRPAQESALARIAGWCHDHRWLVLIIWLGGLVATNVFAQAAGSTFTNNLTGGKQEVQQILNANFPSQAGSPAQVVITTTSPFTDPANQARTDPAGQRPAAGSPTCPGWSARSSPPGAHQISPERAHRLRRVQFDQQAGDLPTAAIKKVISTAQSFAGPGYQVAVGGQAIGMVVGAKPGTE